MKREEFIEIIGSEEIDVKFPDCCNALIGLNLIKKYLPKSGIEGANHDVIYACGVDELVEAGITKEDAIQLRKWNWMYDSDFEVLACFV